MKLNRILAALLILSSVVTVTPAMAAYVFTDLGTMGGPSSAAYAINNAGQIAGQSYSDNSAYATLWNGGIPTNPDTLGSTNSTAFSINNSGVSVGRTYTAGNVSVQATLWNGASATVIGGLSSTAYGINNAGQVVGINGSHAALWNGNTVTDLGTLGGYYSAALGINNFGQATGSSNISNVAYHATLWDTTNSTLTDLGTLGGALSEGFAINDFGKVVGYSFILGSSSGSYDYHATLWDTSKHSMMDIGTLGGASSMAFAINNAGQVVGGAGGPGYPGHAFLWENGTMFDLNSYLDVSTISAGWVLADARGINDNGWIVGEAINSITGARHAFELSVPNEHDSHDYDSHEHDSHDYDFHEHDSHDYDSHEHVSCVPEPESYAMMIVGLGMVGFIVNRRKIKQA